MTAPELPYYPITHDDGLDIIGALNNLAEAESSPSLIAENFDETKSYAVGDYVLYSTLLYRFITPHSAGAWNENHVTSIKVGEELENLTESQSSINSNISTIDSSLAIVSNDNTHIAISSGEYVYVKNHNTLTEGLYTANSSIGENVTLTTSNLTRVQKNNVDIGGLNKLNDVIKSQQLTFSIINNENTTIQVTPGGSWYYPSCYQSGKKLIAIAGFGVWYPDRMRITNIGINFDGSANVFIYNTSNSNLTGFNIVGLYINS